MSRFRFRLQKVLELKELRAQAAANELRIAEQRAGDAESVRDELATLRAQGGDHLAAVAESSATVGELQNISYLLEHIDRRVQLAAASASEAQRQVSDAQAVLALAHQATQTLDRLRERQLGEWQHAMRTSDNQQMDALALARYARTRSQIQDES